MPKGSSERMNGGIGIGNADRGGASAFHLFTGSAVDVPCHEVYGMPRLCDHCDAVRRQNDCRQRVLDDPAASNSAVNVRVSGEKSEGVGVIAGHVSSPGKRKRNRIRVTSAEEVERAVAAARDEGCSVAASGQTQRVLDGPLRLAQCWKKEDEVETCLFQDGRLWHDAQRCGIAARQRSRNTLTSDVSAEDTMAKLALNAGGGQEKRMRVGNCPTPSIVGSRPQEVNTSHLGTVQWACSPNNGVRAESVVGSKVAGNYQSCCLQHLDGCNTTAQAGLFSKKQMPFRVLDEGCGSLNEARCAEQAQVPFFSERSGGMKIPESPKQQSSSAHAQVLSSSMPNEVTNWQRPWVQPQVPSKSHRLEVAVAEHEGLNQGRIEVPLTRADAPMMTSHQHQPSPRSVDQVQVRSWFVEDETEMVQEEEEDLNRHRCMDGAEMWPPPKVSREMTTPEQSTNQQQLEDPFQVYSIPEAEDVVLLHGHSDFLSDHLCLTSSAGLHPSWLNSGAMGKETEAGGMSMVIDNKLWDQSEAHFSAKEEIPVDLSVTETCQVNSGLSHRSPGPSSQSGSNDGRMKKEPQICEEAGTAEYEYDCRRNSHALTGTKYNPVIIDDDDDDPSDFNKQPGCARVGDPQEDVGRESSQSELSAVTTKVGLTSQSLHSKPCSSPPHVPQNQASRMLNADLKELGPRGDLKQERMTSSPQTICCPYANFVDLTQESESEAHHHPSPSLPPYASSPFSPSAAESQQLKSSDVSYAGVRSASAPSRIRPDAAEREGLNGSDASGAGFRSTSSPARFGSDGAESQVLKGSDVNERGGVQPLPAASPIYCDDVESQGLNGLDVSEAGLLSPSTPPPIPPNPDESHCLDRLDVSEEGLRSPSSPSHYHSHGAESQGMKSFDGSEPGVQPISAPSPICPAVMETQGLGRLDASEVGLPSPATPARFPLDAAESAAESQGLHKLDVSEPSVKSSPLPSAFPPDTVDSQGLSRPRVKSSPDPAPFPSDAAEVKGLKRLDVTEPRVKSSPASFPFPCDCVESKGLKRSEVCESQVQFPATSSPCCRDAFETPVLKRSDTSESAVLFPLSPSLLRSDPDDSPVLKTVDISDAKVVSQLECKGKPAFVNAVNSECNVEAGSVDQASYSDPQSARTPTASLVSKPSLGNVCEETKNDSSASSGRGKPVSYSHPQSVKMPAASLVSKLSLSNIGEEAKNGWSASSARGKQAVHSERDEAPSDPGIMDRQRTPCVSQEENAPSGSVGLCPRLTRSLMRSETISRKYGKPGVFEVKWNDSWWDASVMSRKGDTCSVHYTSFSGDDSFENVHISRVRLRSRVLKDEECKELQPGMMVLVFCMHPEAERLTRGKAWYAADVIKADCKQHIRRACGCKVTVRLQPLEGCISSSAKTGCRAERLITNIVKNVTIPQGPCTCPMDAMIDKILEADPT